MAGPSPAEILKRETDEGEPETPPEVLKTLRTLAPEGSSPEHIDAAMTLAAELQQANESRPKK